MSNTLMSIISYYDLVTYLVTKYCKNKIKIWACVECFCVNSITLYYKIIDHRDTF